MQINRNDVYAVIDTIILCVCAGCVVWGGIGCAAMKYDCTWEPIPCYEGPMIVTVPTPTPTPIPEEE